MREIPTVKDAEGYGGALLVTQLVHYSKSKVNSTCMTFTSSCCSMPVHLVCAQWNVHLFFGTGQWPHTSRLRKEYLVEQNSDGVLCQMTWSLQSLPLNWVAMVWEELDEMSQGEAAKAFLESLGNLLENQAMTSWSWLRASQENAKQLYKQNFK